MLNAARLLVPLGFVLTPPNVTSLGLASGARRWNVPADASSHEGLGGGIAFVIESTFCDRLLPRMAEPADCHALNAAVYRAFNSWSANHPTILSFHNLTASVACADAPADVRNHSCPWELRIGTDDGTRFPQLSAYAILYGPDHVAAADAPPPRPFRLRSPNGKEYVGAVPITRATVSVQTHVCFYLDVSFCSDVAGIFGDAGPMLVPLLCPRPAREARCRRG